MRDMRRKASYLLILALLLVASGCGAPGVDRAGTAQEAFTDIPPDAWYADAVAFVNEKGLMTGTDEGIFSPEMTFTRGQMATVLYRLAGEPAVHSPASFLDVESKAWYADAVAWSEQEQVVNGIGDQLYAPDVPVTGEQLLTMLWRREGEPEAQIDDEASDYAAVAVGWARAQDIIPTEQQIMFLPKQPADRAMIATLLYRYLG